MLRILALSQSSHSARKTCRNIMIAFKIPITHLKQSTNKFYAGQHWTKRKEFKDSISNTAALFCCKFEPITSFPVSIRYRFLFETRALDTLNTAIIAKCFEDAFRALKILPDDTPQFVRETILEVIKLPAKKQGGAQASKARAKAQQEDWLEVEISSINK